MTDQALRPEFITVATPKRVVAQVYHLGDAHQTAQLVRVLVARLYHFRVDEVILHSHGARGPASAVFVFDKRQASITHRRAIEKLTHWVQDQLSQLS